MRRWLVHLFLAALTYLLGIAMATAAVSASLRSLGRAQEALRLVEDVPPGPLVTRETVLLALERMDLYRHFGRLLDAVELGEQLVALLNREGQVDAYTRAVALRRRATILWAAGRFSQAAEDLRESARLFTALGDSFGAIFSEGNLGLVYYSMARYDEAEAAKLRAIRAAEQLDARWWLVREIGELAGIYMARGELATALTYCDRQVELARQLRDEAQLGNAKGNRGVTLLLLGRYEEAHPDIAESLRHFEQDGRTEGVTSATVDMTIYLWGVDKLAEAAQLAATNYERARRLGQPVLCLLTGRCLALFGSTETREGLLWEALELARQLNRPLDIAGCLFSLAALASPGRTRDALYAEAEALLKAIGAPTWLNGRSPDNPPFLPLFL